MSVKNALVTTVKVAVLVVTLGAAAPFMLSSDISREEENRNQSGTDTKNNGSTTTNSEQNS